MKLRFKFWLVNLVCFFVCLSAAGQTNTFIVTNTLDNSAFNPASGSLRWAIQQVNSQAAGSTNIIAFNIAGIPPHTIQIQQGELPRIERKIIIDGNTQPNNGYTGASPKIIIQNGQQPYGSTDPLYNVFYSALTFGTGSEYSEVKNLEIKFYGEHGVIWEPTFISQPGLHIIIEANVFKTGRTIMEASTKAIYLGSTVLETASDVRVQNNTIVGPVGTGFLHDNVVPKKTIFVNNNVIKDANIGIWVLTSNATAANTTLEIRGNTITTLPSVSNAIPPFGIDCSAPQGGTINSNQISLPFGGYGIYILRESRNMFLTSNNLTYFNSGGDGITFQSLFVPGTGLVKASDNRAIRNTIKATPTAPLSSSFRLTGISNSGDRNLFSENVIYQNTSSVIANYRAISNGLTGGPYGNSNKAKPTFTGFAGTITGTSQPNDKVELFKSNGPENALQYLSTIAVPASGNWFEFPLGLKCGDRLAATATDAQNNTSELAVFTILPEVAPSRYGCQRVKVEIPCAEKLEHCTITCNFGDNTPLVTLLPGQNMLTHAYTGVQAHSVCVTFTCPTGGGSVQTKQFCKTIATRACGACCDNEDIDDF